MADTAGTATIILLAAALIPVVVSVVRMIRLERREQTQAMANALAAVEADWERLSQGKLTGDSASWGWENYAAMSAANHAHVFNSLRNEAARCGAKGADVYAWRDPWETRP